MTTPELFDPGLQPERTELAWRRTILSLTLGSLISLRLLPPTLGLWSLGVGLIGLGAATTTWILTRRRFRQVQHALTRTTGQLPGAGPLLALTFIASIAAAFGLLYVSRRY